MNLSIGLRRRVSGWVTAEGPESLPAKLIVRAVALRHGVSCRFGTHWISLQRGRDEFRLPLRQLSLVPYVAANFDLFFTAVKPTVLSSGVRLADFSSPRTHELVQPVMTIETAGFPDRLSFDEEYFRRDRPQPGDTVWDLGANVGIAAVEMARLVGPHGTVIAIEPDPENFFYLERNIQRAGFENIRSLNLAISDRNGHAEFFADGTMFAGLAHARRDGVMHVPSQAVARVETITLDTLAELHGRPAFIKIDIEGSEIEALATCSQALSDLPPIACETNHIRGGVRTQHAVEKRLRELGYEVTTGRPLGSFITWARPPKALNGRESHRDRDG